jgi:hypothetical protein
MVDWISISIYGDYYVDDDSIMQVVVSNKVAPINDRRRLRNIRLARFNWLFGVRAIARRTNGRKMEVDNNGFR